VAVQPVRNLTDRDLRTLDLQDFLSLIETDLHEMDELRRERRRTWNERLLPPLESLPLFPVSCCGKYLGSFPRSALVRCPFCEEWTAVADVAPPSRGR